MRPRETKRREGEESNGVGVRLWFLKVRRDGDGDVMVRFGSSLRSIGGDAWGVSDGGWSEWVLRW